MDKKNHIKFKQELFKKIKINKNGCWVWQGSPSQGYGEYRRIIDNIKFTTAHRASYYLFNDDFDKDLFVLHKCSQDHTKDNCKCICPSHLYQGTHKDNMKDMAIAGTNKGENNAMYGKPGTRLGVKLTTKIKDKIRQSQLSTKNHMYGKYGKEHNRFGVKHTESTKIKISKSRKNKMNGIDNPASKQWKVISPNGEKFIVEDMVKFCKDKEIKHISFITNKTWYGWKCKQKGEKN